MKINKELLKGGTPILVLKLLSQKDRYGYDIIKTLMLMSNNVFTLREGSLYPVLKTLEEGGYVNSYWEDTTSERKRKYYHITEEGMRRLKELHAEWEYYVESMENVLGLEGELI